VKLYQHPNKENRGAGASRNLGIGKATCSYIAFLDADDWYLPNRFVKAKEIFLNNKDVDGVYEATGFFNESTQVLDPERLTTLKEIVSAEDLLFTLLTVHAGRFTTDAITIQKSILKKSGFFDESLRLHQDTHLWLRLAHVGKLVPGQLNEPVAIRRTHENNRIQHLNKESRRLLNIKTLQWFEQQKKVDPRAFRIIFKRYVSSSKNSIPGKIFFSAMYLIRNPTSINKMV
jgi:glycosyltransferase involved in cell wall biosynthesis